MNRSFSIDSDDDVSVVDVLIRYKVENTIVKVVREEEERLEINDEGGQPSLRRIAPADVSEILSVVFPINVIIVTFFLICS